MLRSSHILWFMVLFFFTGCAHYQRPELIGQILKPRTGYKGITNSACDEYDFWGKCKSQSIVDYDLHDKEVRKKLIDFGFRCLIAGNRYKIDPDQPGFARYETVSECWFCEDKVLIVKRIPIEKYQYLIDAGTVCYSEKEYPNGT